MLYIGAFNHDGIQPHEAVFVEIDTFADLILAFGRDEDFKPVRDRYIVLLLYGACSV